MQTLEFTRALSDIAKRLKADEIVSLMQPWVSPATPPNTPIDDGARDKFYELVLASHSGYDQLSRVGPTDRILSELNIRETYEPARLRRMTVFLANSSTIQQVRTNGELYGFFEILRSLLKFDRTCRNLLEKEKIGEVPASDEVLEFLFADYEGKGVEPERLSAAFMELAELQMNVARLLGVADHRLRVKYLDSGSDIKIGLEGAREVIEAVGALFLQFWDKIRFRDQDTFEKDMEALSKALEFLAKSEEAVNNGSITPEEAAILRERVFQGVNELVGLGVTLPFQGEGAAEERKQLIERRSTKLLGTGQPSKPAEGGPKTAE
jgi:hypothetical protein